MKVERHELETVIYEKDGPVARIILNRPDKANAQNSAMAWDVDNSLKDAEADYDVVKQLHVEAGLIDDASFARAWVESRHHSRGLSRRSLSAELRRRGVDSEEIREAVDTLDPEQEAATARRLVEQKLASTRGQSPEARARRTASLLARKGYPPGLAFRLIREVMQEEGAADVIDLDDEPYIAPEDELPED